MEKDEAIQTLKDNKLKAEVIEETSKDIKEGYITKQETTAGTVVNAGDTIKIHVSTGTGIKQVVVPSVMGKDLNAAKETLTSLGLKVEVEYNEDTTKNNGIVLSQNTNSGSVVDEGTTIVITVNQITETKYGTVQIDLKTLTGYKEEKDEEGEIVKAEEVKVKVVVKSEGKEETAYEKSVAKDNEKLTVNISGKGTVTVKVYIDNQLGGREYQLNLNEKTTLEVK